MHGSIHEKRRRLSPPIHFDVQVSDQHHPFLYLLLFGLSACSQLPAANARWPEPASVRNTSGSAQEAADRDRVEQQPVCVGSRGWSAGTLGDTVLFRSRRVGNKLVVGYFVYWSTERPWGANMSSYLLLPALATDAFYSHFLYVFPGAKDALYGPGDIEGVLVEFESRANGELFVVGGMADDGNHAPTALSHQDLVDSKGRVVLLTEVWSHQLGARGAGGFADTRGEEVRCYEKSALHPMTKEVARAFRLGDEERPLRAGPAWRYTVAERSTR